MSDTFLRLVCIVVAAVIVAGCGIGNIGFRDTKAKTEVNQRGSEPVRPLELPPELELPAETPQRSSYLASESIGGLAGAKQTGPEAAKTNAASLDNLGRSYIRIGAPPKTVQLQVLDFWRNLGVPLARSDPSAGLVETEWMRGYASRTMGTEARDQMDRFTMTISAGQRPTTSRVYLRHEARQEQAAADSEARLQGATPDRQLETLMLERLQAFLRN